MLPSRASNGILMSSNRLLSMQPFSSRVPMCRAARNTGSVCARHPGQRGVPLVEYSPLLDTPVDYAIPRLQANAWSLGMESGNILYWHGQVCTATGAKDGEVPTLVACLQLVHLIHMRTGSTACLLWLFVTNSYTLKLVHC
jgi:hypothetical protein